MTWTAELIEALLKHLTDRIALAVLFASSIVSLLMLIFSEVHQVLQPYQFFIFGSLLVSACYLPTGFIIRRVGELSSSHKRQQRLYRLTPREKEILGPYVHNNWRIRRIRYDDPVAKVLADDGMLYAPDVPPDNNGYVAYSIQDWTLSFLREHTDLVAPPGALLSGYER